MPTLAALYDGDRELYMSTARQAIQNLANLLRDDAIRRGAAPTLDRGWEGPPRVASSDPVSISTADTTQ